MNYVDIHGRTFLLPDKAAKSRRPTGSRTTGDAEKRHLGYIVTGYPPDMVAEAKAAREAEIKAAVAAGRLPPDPWDVEAWMRTAKPKKVRSKPYEVAAAAAECAAMAEFKAGWIGVRWEPLLR